MKKVYVHAKKNGHNVKNNIEYQLNRDFQVQLDYMAQEKQRQTTHFASEENVNKLLRANDFTWEMTYLVALSKMLLEFRDVILQLSSVIACQISKSDTH